MKSIPSKEIGLLRPSFPRQGDRYLGAVRVVRRLRFAANVEPTDQLVKCLGGSARGFVLGASIPAPADDGHGGASVSTSDRTRRPE